MTVWLNANTGSAAAVAAVAEEGVSPFAAQHSLLTTEANDSWQVSSAPLTSRPSLHIAKHKYPPSQPSIDNNTFGGERGRQAAVLPVLQL